MANDVYHYLYGSKELVNFFEENRYDLTVFPIDLEWKAHDECLCYIQFSTRGVEYPFKMEENCVRQAVLTLEGGKVTVVERGVTQQLMIIFLNYS